MSDVPKIVKPDERPVTPLEKEVAGAIAELELNSEMKSQLRQLYIVGAIEKEFGGKKCIVVYVPVPQLSQFQKIQVALVRELEKKFSGKHVLIIGKRRIQKKPKRGRKLKQKRPISRTLTAVHNAILSDMTYPAEVTGRRIRVKLDGKRVHKVHLDKTQQIFVEHKVDTFAGGYKHLTGKEVHFQFPEPLF